MRFLLKVALALRRLYWWIVRPETLGVRAIVVNDRAQILLVKHKYGSGWYLPGGKAGKQESLEQALRRELAQEAGITSCNIDRIMGTYVNRQEYKKDTITVFVVKDVRRFITRHFEIEVAQYFDLKRLPADTSPGTRRRIEEYLGVRPVSTDW